MGSVCRGKNFSTSETSINHLPLNPNRTVKLCLLCFRGPKLLNLCQILTVIQCMDGDFLDVENLQMGEEIKQSYTCVLLSGWGWLNLAEPQKQEGSLGRQSMEKQITHWLLTSPHCPNWSKGSCINLYRGFKLPGPGALEFHQQCHRLPLQEDSVIFHHQH